jgi:hypothetical protein
VNKQSGAMGPYQFLPSTVSMLHKAGMKFNPFVEEEARPAAQAYLNMLLQQNGGDMNKALAAYGGGMVNGNITPNGAAYVSKVASAQPTGQPQQQPAQAPSSRFMASEPPLGTVAHENVANEAAPKAMQDSWKQLQPVVANSAAIDQALAHMQELAKQKTDLLTAGPLGTEVAPLWSKLAQKYEKERANVNTLLGQGAGGGPSGNTDMAKELLGASLPDWGKRGESIIYGTQQLRDQVAARTIKGQFLTDPFNKGDATTFTKMQTEFDTHVSPAMAAKLKPILAMPPGPARAAVLQTAAKEPKMRETLEWAVKSGLLRAK